MSLFVAPRTSTLPTPGPTELPTRTVAAPRTPSFALRDVSTFHGGPISASASSPGAGGWRGGPDTEIGRAIAPILERLRQCPVRLKGQTAEEVFTNAILDNKRVSNEQILQMTRITLEQVADSPEERAQVLRKIPDARQRDSHRFTVALLSAATGIDPQALSEATPSLGMTGAPGTPLLYAPSSGRMKRSTALHDFTDYLRGAGIQGLNRAVWGVEDRILSALKSAIGRWRY